MSHWIYPANTKYYDVIGALSKENAFWPMNSKVSVGDVIFIYLAAPYKQICTVCLVTEIHLKESDIIEETKPFLKKPVTNNKPSKLFMKLRIKKSIPLEQNTLTSYNNLKENGLNGMLMGPRKLENNPVLFNYILGACDELS